LNLPKPLEVIVRKTFLILLKTFFVIALTFSMQSKNLQAAAANPMANYTIDRIF